MIRTILIPRLGTLVLSIVTIDPRQRHPDFIQQWSGRCLFSCVIRRRQIMLLWWSAR